MILCKPYIHSPENWEFVRRAYANSCSANHLPDIDDNLDLFFAHRFESHEIYFVYKDEKAIGFFILALSDVTGYLSVIPFLYPSFCKMGLLNIFTVGLLQATKFAIGNPMVTALHLQFCHKIFKSTVLSVFDTECIVSFTAMHHIVHVDKYQFNYTQESFTEYLAIRWQDYKIYGNTSQSG